MSTTNITTNPENAEMALITPGVPFIPAPLAPMAPLRRSPSHHVAAGANVLLVDRHAETRKLLGNFLQQQGYRVWRAASAQDAQALLTQQHMDLVTLDVLLPDGQGPELIRHLRNDAVMAERPIVVISSLGSTRNVCAGLTCGADDYIAKPVALGVVAARLGALLRRYGWNAE